MNRRVRRPLRRRSLLRARLSRFKADARLQPAREATTPAVCLFECGQGLARMATREFSAQPRA